MNTNVLKEGSVSLSPQDRLILEGYKPLVDAIGQLFGDCCEVVLHSLEDLSHSVIWIHNGAKTGRKIGSPVTDKALSVLRQCEQTGSSFSKLYLTQTVNGATMRSTTTVIKGIAGNPIGLFCINFDISMPFNQLAQILVEPKNENEAGGEHFAIDLDDLFLTKVRQVEQEVKNDPNIPVRRKTYEIIVRLSDEGVFKIRKAVPRIAKVLNISRDVIYMHLRKHEEALKSAPH